MSGIFNVHWDLLHPLQRADLPDPHWDRWIRAYSHLLSEKDYIAVYAAAYKKCAGFS